MSMTANSEKFRLLRARFHAGTHCRCRVAKEGLHP
jgi:hypothetical protein